MGNWELEEKQFKIETAMAYEGLFTLGSGYLHTRGSLEENVGVDPQNITNPIPAFANASAFKHGGVQKTKWGTYVPGVFAHHPNLNEEMVNLPYFLGVEPSIAGGKLDLLQSSISDYRRRLDMKTASLVRSLIWHSHAGDVQVKFERFISAACPQLSVQRVSFTAINHFLTLSIKAGIDADVRTNGCDHFEYTRVEQLNQNTVKTTVLTNENSFYDKDNKLTNVSGGDTVYTVSQLSEAAWEFTKEKRRGYLTCDFNISKGETLVIEKRSAVSTSRDLECYEQAEDVIKSTNSLSYDELLNLHKKVWQRRWDKADVKIESTDKKDNSQQVLRSSIYHLLRCHVPGDSRVAIDAKGTAGDIYYGRYFWDTEIYMMPFYLYTDPEQAKTLMDFRVQSLFGAKRNAKRGGYKGARYSWESDSQGNDCCPPGNWQYRDHEIHISADIAYAFSHFAANTGKEYLKNPKNAEVLVEIARYWIDRVDWQDDIPHLLGVMGPDEYTALISDNAYTNFMVSYALKLAEKYGSNGGASKEEILSFSNLAAKLPVLKDKDGVILQCKEFDDFADPKFKKVWPGYAEGKPQGHYAQYVTQERLYRTKSLKQADVLMLMFLFFTDYSKEEILKTWDKYVPYTTHDSSLSLGVHGLLANKIGKEKLSWEMFQKCMGNDLDVENEGAAEGIHIAGCGMNWQMMTFGVAGILTALQSDIFTMDPHLFKTWNKISFPFNWKNQKLHITVEQDKTVISNEGNQKIEVIVSGEKRNIEVGKLETFYK